MSQKEKIQLIVTGAISAALFLLIVLHAWQVISMEKRIDTLEKQVNQNAVVLQNLANFIQQQIKQ